jgi:hypothetical protein
MAVGTRMQQRRGSAAEWDTSDYILADGEIGWAEDTGIIKIGNGADGWTDLEPAFNTLYLPILGTAANSELLEGIGSDGFLKPGDASTSALANTIAKRLSDGRLKSAAAISTDDVVNYDGMVDYATNTTIPVGRRIVGSRLVTTAFTVASSDVGKRILVNHASTTAFVTATLPANSGDPLPVGSWVDIVTQGAGGVKIVPTGADAIRGTVYVFPGYDAVRVIRTSTVEWLILPQGRDNRTNRPKMRIYCNATVNYVAAQHHGIAYHAVDTTETYNPSNEWFEIPGTGIATARRIIVKQDGEYDIRLNFAGSLATAMQTRIVKMTADNTPGNTLSQGAAGIAINLSWRGRLSAGESIGGTHYSPSGTDTGAADDPASNRNELRIFRVGN